MGFTSVPRPSISTLSLIGTFAISIITDQAIGVECTGLGAGPHGATRVTRFPGPVPARTAPRCCARILCGAKFWNCRRVPSVTEEVIQSIGGNAYIEEHPCPRYYREAPLNAIWEGTSNMMVMDVGRVLTREPKAIEPVIDEIRPHRLQAGVRMGDRDTAPCAVSISRRSSNSPGSGDRA